MISPLLLCYYNINERIKNYLQSQNNEHLIVANY